MENGIMEKDNLWLCLSCHLCVEACPMNVKVSHIIMLLKNMAVERGKVPNGFLDEVNSIFKTGRSMPLSPAIDKRRATFSLPPLPSVDVEEVRILMKKLKLPFNEEEKR